MGKIILVVELFILFLFCGCKGIDESVKYVSNSEKDDNMHIRFFRHTFGFFSTDEQKADKKVEQIVSAINDEDIEALKALFSQKAISEIDNFEEQAKTAFEFIDGKIVSWKSDIGTSSESIQDGKRSQMLQYGIYFTINRKKFNCFVIDYDKDTINPENEGVYMIEITPDDYIYESWQERMAPGIIIPELDEVVELNETGE